MNPTSQHAHWQKRHLLLGFGCLLVIVLGLLLSRHDSTDSTTLQSSAPSATPAVFAAPADVPRWRTTARNSEGLPPITAQEIVAAKVSQLSSNRLAVFRAMAKRFNVE